MQARKVNSAFRLSSKQSDSLKMKNSLGQLLGESSRSRIDDHLKDIDISAPQSTSSSVRYNGGSFRPAKEKQAGAFLGMRGDMMDSEVFGPQTGLFAQLKKTLDDIALLKKSQMTPENRTTGLFGDQKINLNFNFDFTKNLLSELNKQSSIYNLVFPLEVAGSKQHQAFNAKLKHLQNLEQQLATSHTSENSPINKTAAGFLKLNNNKMDIQKRKDSYHDISSLNSLEEEIDTHVKPATQLNHLSISSANQFDGLNLKTVKSEANGIITPEKEERSGVAQAVQDFSKATLQQRLEHHYAKNMKFKAEKEEGLHRRDALLGTYLLDERIRKILHYKKKIIKWRAAHPPNRSFTGRSAVAGSKPRIKGKFVKKDEYQKHLEIQKKTN